MKILHVIGRLSRHDGGPSKAVRDMARALADRDHEVWIYTTAMVAAGEAAPPLDRIVDEGRARIRFFPIARPHAWIRSPALGAALAQMIPSCDLVVIHSLYLYHSRKAAALCLRAGVPYVIRPHGTLDPYLWRRRRWLKRLFEWWHQNRDLRHATAVHFTTDAERQLAQPYVHGAPGFVVPLGLRPEQPPAPAVRRDGNTLLYLGRLHPKKGIELLIDAFARLMSAHPELRLRIAGSGDPAYTRSLHARRTALGLDGRIEFIGFVSGEAKRQLLAEAGLFVLPSYSENFGIAVIEAMASGLPVLVSAHVNLCDEVMAADAGWVCAATVESLTTTLSAALNARADWPAIGARARQHALAHFDWATVAETLEAEYRRIASPDKDR